MSIFLILQQADYHYKFKALVRIPLLENGVVFSR